MPQAELHEILHSILAPGWEHAFDNVLPESYRKIDPWKVIPEPEPLPPLPEVPLLLQKEPPPPARHEGETQPVEAEPEVDDEMPALPSTGRAHDILRRGISFKRKAQ